MRNEEIFAMWAPPDSPWALWAKPVLFASMRAVVPVMSAGTEPPAAADAAWAPPPNTGTAIVVDLPGAAAVREGLALARRGYRPVPLFNACEAPSMVVDVTPISRALLDGAVELSGLRLRDDAPPAFLLDAARLASAHAAFPGRYDNRWCVVPQDMPSANRLRGGGIEAVALRAERVQDDLAHVLLRYQQAGLTMRQSLPGGGDLLPLDVPRPSRFRVAWYRILAMAGLHRNATGGFGALIPMPSSSGGHGYG
jgi:hypothetical protein